MNNEEKKLTVFQTLLANFTDDMLHQSIVETMEKRLNSLIQYPVIFENNISYTHASCTGETLQYTASVPEVFKSYMYERTNSTAVLKELERRLEKFKPHSVGLYFHGVKEIMCVRVIIVEDVE